MPEHVAVCTRVKCVVLRSAFDVKCAECKNMPDVSYKFLKVKSVLVIRQQYLGFSEITLNCCHDTRRYDLEED